MDEYKEGLRDYQNGQIGKLGEFISDLYIKKFHGILHSHDKPNPQLTDLTDAEEVYSSIIKDFPTYLTAHISLIQKLELAEIKGALPFTTLRAFEKLTDLDTTKVTLERIINLANVVIQETNSDALLAHYGLKTDNRPDAAKIKMYVETYYRCIYAQNYLIYFSMVFFG